MDFQSVVQQLFGLDGSKIGGGPAPTAPPPPAKNATLDDSPQGKVLATLAQRSTPQLPGGGPFGLPVGQLPDVKGKSKGSAFATGLSSGMNASQNHAAAQSKADQERAALNLKTMQALFTAQETARGNDIRAEQAKKLGGYYDAMGEYYRNGGAKGGAGVDPANNEYKRQLALSSAAQRAGLGDKALAAQLGSPIPAVANAAKEELARRQGVYNSEAAQINKQFAAAGAPVKPVADATTGKATAAATGDPAAAGATPAGATPAPATPAPAAGATPAPAAGAAGTPPVASPETWRVIRGPNGERQYFNPATGATKPMESATTAPPSSAAGPYPNTDAPPDPAAPDDDGE